MGWDGMESVALRMLSDVLKNNESTIRTDIHASQPLRSSLVCLHRYGFSLP